MTDSGGAGARPSDQALAVPAEPASGLVPPGFDPSRWLDKLALFIVASLVCAAIYSALIMLVGLAVEGAAWFALGADKPRTPWFLLRFFLFIGWCFSPIAGLSAVFSDSDASLAEDAERLSPEGVAARAGTASPNTSPVQDGGAG